MKSGVEFIAQERWRQINQEGWTSSHDDQHKGEELARAAATYAIPQTIMSESVHPGIYISLKRMLLWPFRTEWYKPSYKSDRIKELAKAGALIAAEIDRLQRLKSNSESDITSKA